MRKQGINDQPSKVTTRPDAPAPLKRADNRPSYQQIKDTVQANIKRMREAGESHVMMARWLSEDIDKLYPPQPTPTVIAHLDGTFCHYQWNVQIPNSGQMPLYAHPDTDELTKAARDLLEWYDAPDCANDAPPYIEALREALTAKPAKQYSIGPETMRMVFDPNNLTDMSDLQRVLDAVEVALDRKPWAVVEKSKDGELALFSTKFNVRLASFRTGASSGFNVGDKLYR